MAENMMKHNVNISVQGHKRRSRMKERCYKLCEAIVAAQFDFSIFKKSSRAFGSILPKSGEVCLNGLT